MLKVALVLAFVLLGAALLLTGWRLLIGPTVPDRMVAFDTLYINIVALLVALGIYFDSTLYFEAALFIALLGFIGTVALCRFFSHGRLFQ
ncbi:MAG: K+/H+ antiporter subunit F [Candidatus Competibacteraceae bacterium]|uniref:PH adaptation potassium efflux system protein F n=1 Tax=Candidatus Contendobacter odensis Run_B_J11 TaxID=1400861 RepID=A0A7U7GAE7_9GAMM|nr:K+/H+ antiporter subunit F [Candidatus Contendobacter odensis]MBK8534381.1 K+/H+ antiporter subunit F [Candidatus Competibacteraceae bacterium]MBK8751837.1 K+/H+ antiporter subunit F [Candidatus Competibacteraceae bacterium]CDH44704.1 pH adaptation potassium efflux system protein F [Candidatus Contendobacter odensis Run_B_J11]